MSKNHLIDQPGRLLTATVIATIAVVTLASWLPGERMWGINHLAFYPAPVRIAALVLAVAALVPAVGRTAYGMLLTAMTGIRRKRRVLAVAIPVVSLSSVFAFYKLKAATWLLGDGQVIANQLAHLFSRPVTIPFAATKIFQNDFIAPGTHMLYALSAMAVRPFMGEDPANGIIVMNCVVGGAFVFVVLMAALRSSLSAEQALWLIVLSLTSATLQLFFGYVENYALVYFLGCLFAILAVRALHGHSVWLPLIPLLVALVCHVESVLFLPSYGFVLASRFVRRRRERVLPRVAPAIIAAVSVAALVAALLTPLRRFFLPLYPTGGQYAVLSLRHLIDILNELLMLLPALPLIAGMAWVLRAPAEETVALGDASRGSRPWFSTKEEWDLALLLIVPCILYLVFFNPEIGMARDWDLFSILNVGLVLLSLLVLTRFKHRFDTSSAKAPLVSAFVLGLVLVVSWVGINASPVRSTARFESILEYDRTHASYAFENLARSYHAQNRLPDAIRAIENACAISHNPRQLVLLARYYEEFGDTENSLRVLKDAVSRRPEYELPRRELCVDLLRMGRFAELEVVAREGTVETPRASSFHYFLGKSLVALGRLDEARTALLRGRQLGLPAPVAADVDQLLEQMNGESGGD